MAESPSHKLGQIIGNLVEAVIEPFLSGFAEEKHLYLDYKKRLRKSRKGKKVTWEDRYGNVHDLDYVLEKDGNDTTGGIPVAFIEVAWRRYTKHSRNKVQEIQGAILPLAERFQWSNPFLGAVLAGVFTEGSLEQLRSLGFQVLYFPYETLVDAFAEEGIAIGFNEATPDEAFRKCVKKIEASSEHKMERIKRHPVVANQEELDKFMAALSERLSRMVERVVIIPLYGRLDEFETIDDAIRFLDEHQVYDGLGEFQKYEVFVTFSNGDRVEGAFKEKGKARDFLQFVAKQ